MTELMNFRFFLDDIFIGWSRTAKLSNKLFQHESCLGAEVSQRANQFWMDLSDNLAQCSVVSEEQ